MRTLLSSFGSIVLLSAAFGCGSASEELASPALGPFPLEIGPAGGKAFGAAESAIEGVVLEVPEGALDHVVRVDAFPIQEDVVLGPTASFVGPQVALVPDGIAFAKPVQLTVPLDPAMVDDYEQSAADCRVWFRRDGSWSQIPQVASTETSVTISVDTLGGAAAGVVSTPKTAPGATPAPCDSPTGFCVDVLSETLEPGAIPTSVSLVAGERFAYHRADPVKIDASGNQTRSYAVVEYDLATGKNVLDTAKLVTTSAPGRILGVTSRVSHAPDGTSYWFAVPGYGTLQYPKQGQPVRAADGTSGNVTSHVAHTSDGRRWRFEIAGGSAKTPAATLAVSVQAPGASPLGPTVVERFDTTGSLGALPVLPEGTRNGIAYIVSAAAGKGIAKELRSNAPGTDLPLPEQAAGLDFATNAFDEIAVSTDGNTFAVSLAKLDAQGARLYIRSRSGSVSLAVKGLPNLAGLELASDGFIWAFGATAAEVYRINPANGAVQSVRLTTETPGTPGYSDRIPVAIRAAAAGELLVVVGQPPLKVIEVTPVQMTPTCNAAITCSGHGMCNAQGACACNVGFAGAACDTCAPDHYAYPLCTFCQASTTCSTHGACSANGSCVCTPGFTGAGCSSCDLNYYGYPACTFCLASSTCNGHGNCGAQGACTCNQGFAGAACGSCDVDYYGYPTCTFCLASSTCNGHGSCGAQGACTCNTGFTGAACTSCDLNYYGYPACTFCLASSTCNGHGSCGAQGACTCNAGYQGAACDACAPGFSGYPNCQ